MRGRMTGWAGAAVLLLASAGPIAAASLQVSPITIERFAPAVASTLTLTNTGAKPMRVQIRVFRWQQSRGIESLRPSLDAVASPPATSLTAGTDYTVRVLRVARTPVVGEEAYRVLVDELPSPESVRPDSVRLLLRYSIPVFFVAADATPPKVSWGVSFRKGRLHLSAENAGDRHFKVASASLRDGAGRSQVLAKGLVGYVLGGSRMTWSFGWPGRPPKSGPVVLRVAVDGALTDVPVTLVQGG